MKILDLNSAQTTPLRRANKKSSEGKMGRKVTVVHKPFFMIHERKIS